MHPPTAENQLKTTLKSSFFSEKVEASIENGLCEQ